MATRSCIFMALLALAGVVGCDDGDGQSSADTTTSVTSDGATATDMAADIGEPPDAGPVSAEWASDYRGTQAGACANDDEGDFANFSQVTVGGTTLYAGYEQVSGNNQDPVVARFDGGQKTWCRYHEDDGPDGRAVALAWDGGAAAYVVYTVVGGGTDLEGQSGWLDSYAPGAISGGNKKVAVVGQVDAATGDLLAASFFMAVLSDGGLNSHSPVDEALGLPPISVLEDGTVQFMGSSAHKPIDADGRSSMECTDYPFTSRYVLSPDLSTLVCAECTNCVSQQPCE